LRNVLFAAFASAGFLAFLVFAGPVSSGSILLLVPSLGGVAAQDLPDSYTPLHKGHIDLSTGLYIRNNEDLIVRGTPPLILRRTYISRFREPRQFGIGAMHNGEWYVIGDGKRFQWAALVRPGESRIRFERTSPGASLLNAMFEHRSSGGEWQGAKLGWTGLNWALRKADGSLMLFQPCGGSPGSVCSITQQRGAAGHAIYYRRDRPGRLSRIETEDNRWIAFDYDERDRIVRASTSTMREVRYEYDSGGRLARVTAGDRLSIYTYTDRDELATIIEPGTDIENAYDSAGRCARQVNRYPDRDPYVFDFTYVTKGDSLAQTTSARSDGTWARYTFDENSFTTSETLGSSEPEVAMFTFERDASTHAVTALTLTCPDRRGILLRHSSLVRPGQEEQLKRELMETHCFPAERRLRDSISRLR
jgi:YD repeat-containing protein